MTQNLDPPADESPEPPESTAPADPPPQVPWSVLAAVAGAGGAVCGGWASAAASAEAWTDLILRIIDVI